jgi:hypothetical protein
MMIVVSFSHFFKFQINNRYVHMWSMIQHFACLNFLIHIDLDMDAIPFPLEDRPVQS